MELNLLIVLFLHLQKKYVIDNSIFYNNNCGIPDFGKIIGCNLYLFSNNVYSYSANDFKPSDLTLYYNALTLNGIMYVNSFYNNDGNLIYVYRN